MATPDEQLKTLKTERKVIKSSLTKFHTFLKTIHERGFSINVYYLIEARLTKINSAYDRFLEVQNAIDKLEDLIDQEAEEAQANEFEESYFTSVARAKEIMYEIKRAEEPHANSSQSQNNTNAPRRHVRLPMINVPKFSGNIENWIEFRDIFIALIHTNEELSSIEKFQFLRSAIEQSEAITAIQGCGLSADGYDAAWKIVCDRYDNAKRLMNSHINALVNFPAIAKESAKQLCNLIDTFAKNVQALESLGEKTEHWDSFLIFLIVSKLDMHIVKEWETHDSENEKSKLADLIKFLQRKVHILQTIESKQNETKGQTQRASVSSEIRKFKPKVHAHLAAVNETNNSQTKCSLCKGEHRIATCLEFNQYSVAQRFEKIKELHLCLNCLRPGHSRIECRGSFCRICKRKHHTLIHDPTKTRSSSNLCNTTPTPTVQTPSLETVQSNSAINTGATISNVAHSAYENAHVLLPTATIVVRDKFNNAHYVRALLDSGSQSNFVTSDLIERLNLPTHSLHIQLLGITQTSKTITSYCNVIIESRTECFKTTAQCLILNEITGSLPNVQLEMEGIKIPTNISLADPNYNKSRKVDVLIGFELFWTILYNESIAMGPGLPILRKTAFGWVIGGSHQLPATKAKANIETTHTNCAIVKDLLVKFWKIEEYEPKLKLTIEEEYCEQTFNITTRHNANGRFVVDLPFKRDPSHLGDSFENAKRRFLNLEKKLKTNESKRKQYRTFIHEYIDMQHMTETRKVNTKEMCYYLPHHAVYNENSSTTKLRVVFDASARSTTGISLNDILCVGPTMQQDLISILIRFRTHYYALSTDIKKMYRQVLVNENHRRFQRILWRDDETKPLKSYDLNTVTYGTAPASYLAIKCLFRLADEMKGKFPHISTIIRDDFYVDNLLTGANTMLEAEEIINVIQETLTAVGFDLHPWITSKSFLSNRNEKEHSSSIDIGEEDNNNTLGLMWSTHNDSLFFKSKYNVTNEVLTKRLMLSQISQIFDPLGILAPIIINVKLLLQSLWLLKLDWDDEIPLDLMKPWSEFIQTIKCLKEVSIPRFVLQPKYDYVQLHGFADASVRAYAACVYLRTANGTYFTSHLLVAKTRVAPNKTITIPRLELCACVLLSRLVQKVLSSLRLPIRTVHLWTDSTIVLAWLKMIPSTMKPFVAHRIAEIQEALPNAIWNHVRTHENPADIASRGASYNQFLSDKLWLKGPTWLNLPESQWPNLRNIEQNNAVIPEIELKTTSAVITTETFLNFDAYSSMSKIERILAYCKRFSFNCKATKLQATRKIGPLTLSELNDSLLIVVKIVQKQYFANEIETLKNRKNLKPSSNIIKLSPFLDEHEILRVGGRLKHSNVDIFAKHPAILPGKDTVSKLIMRRTHIKMMHIGPQGLLYATRQNFWILSGRRLANKIVHNCMTCFKAKPRVVYPKMGDLPSERVTPSHPFWHCGIDYAGPIQLKTTNKRGNKTYKAYICIYLCLSTKAVHLELITSLTTEAFIACLRRFASRRGVPHSIFSDNGTNFIGANRELKELSEFLKREKGDIIEKTVSENITWRFSPPRAPHFGGIWEAGVKSLKFHLKRVIGEQILTYEDFNTLLTQIEAILNSRPLSPLSSNPNDYSPLTPGHFLIGRSFNTIPDVDLKTIPEARLSTFQRIQSIYQQFWKRWSLEYLNQLQPRKKWERSTSSKLLQPGNLVIIAEDNLPPLCWKMGRIVKCHPGKDGDIRVVTIRTTTSTFQRPVVKICLLPIYEDSVEQENVAC